MLPLHAPWHTIYQTVTDQSASQSHHFIAAQRLSALFSLLSQLVLWLNPASLDFPLACDESSHDFTQHTFNSNLSVTKTYSSHWYWVIYMYIYVKCINVYIFTFNIQLKTAEVEKQTSGENPRFHLKWCCCGSGSIECSHRWCYSFTCVFKSLTVPRKRCQNSAVWPDWSGHKSH